MKKSDKRVGANSNEALVKGQMPVTRGNAVNKMLSRRQLVCLSLDLAEARSNHLFKPIKAKGALSAPSL